MTAMSASVRISRGSIISSITATTMPRRWPPIRWTITLSRAASIMRSILRDVWRAGSSFAAALEAMLQPSVPGYPAEWFQAMDAMSKDAHDHYIAHIRDNPDTIPYFEEATPAGEFDLAKIGSRPARRKR
ncbi:phosphoenolpyruvate carboxylase, partial [Lacticaseibacillus rhamnosus]